MPCGSLKTTENPKAIRSKCVATQCRRYIFKLIDFPHSLCSNYWSCPISLNPWYCLGQKPLKGVLIPRVSFQDHIWYYQLTLFSPILAVHWSLLGWPSPTLCFDLTHFVIRIALADALMLQHWVGAFARIAQSTLLCVLPLLFRVFPRGWKQFSD